MKQQGARVEQEVRPLRMRPMKAAIALGLEYQTVRKLMSQGVFTIIKPGERVGNKKYLLYDEVEAYAFGGREAVAELRAKQGRK